MYKILIFLLFPFIFNGQDKLLGILPLKDSDVYYSNVLEIEGISKIELSNRARNWLMNSNNNFDEIINLNNNYNEIKSQGSFKELWGPNDYPELYVEIFHTVSFQFRNGRYQYEISNFIVKKSDSEIELEIFKMSHNKNLKYNKIFYEKIDDYIKKMASTIENKMNKNTSHEQ